MIIMRIMQETFNAATRSYEEKLCRSDALVQEMGEAGRAKEVEFVNLRDLYTELQGDYEQLFGDGETKDGVIEASHISVDSICPCAWLPSRSYFLSSLE